MPSISELRKKYSAMSLTQKKQFCQNLQKSIENQRTPENVKFLNECVSQYNEEFKASKESGSAVKNKPVSSQSEKVSPYTIKKTADVPSTDDGEISTKKAYIISAVFLVVVIVLLIFIPLIRWILFFVALENLTSHTKMVESFFSTQR